MDAVSATTSPTNRSVAGNNAQSGLIAVSREVYASYVDPSGPSGLLHHDRATMGLSSIPKVIDQTFIYLSSA